jgi:hypothetical protein
LGAAGLLADFRYYWLGWMRQLAGGTSPGWSVKARVMMAVLPTSVPYW